MAFENIKRSSGPAGLLSNFLCFSLILLFCYTCYLFVSFNIAAPFDTRDYGINISEKEALSRIAGHFNQNFSVLGVGAAFVICFFLSWIFKGKDEKSLRATFGCGLLIVGMLTIVSFPDLLFYTSNGRFYNLALWLTYIVASGWILYPYSHFYYSGNFITAVTIAVIAFAVLFVLYLIVQFPGKESPITITAVPEVNVAGLLTAPHCETHRTDLS